MDPKRIAKAKQNAAPIKLPALLCCYAFFTEIAFSAVLEGLHGRTGKRERKKIVSCMEKEQIWSKAKKPYPSVSDEVRAP
jgi:hypothetical protein